MYIYVRCIPYNYVVCIYNLYIYVSIYILPTYVLYYNIIVIVLDPESKAKKLVYFNEIIFILINIFAVKTLCSIIFFFLGKTC